jgi:hypothetical protein
MALESCSARPPSLPASPWNRQSGFPDSCLPVQLKRWTPTPARDPCNDAPPAVAPRPGGQTLASPAGPQPRPCVAEKPTRGPMDCPGRRQGRAHPAKRPAEEQQRSCRPSGEQTNTPAANREASDRSLRDGCATEAQQQERLSVKREGHRDGPRAAGEGWRDPVALLIAARAVCRFCRRTLGEHGQLGRSGSSRQQCRHANVRSAIGATGTGRAHEHAEIGSKRANLGDVTTPGRSPGVVTGPGRPIVQPVSGPMARPGRRGEHLTMGGAGEGHLTIDL